MKLNTLTLASALTLLKSKEIKLADLYSDIQKEISAKNPQLNIFLAVDELAQAKAEKNLNKPLMGLPVAVKDNFLTKDLVTTASSKVLKDFHPPYESTVTAKLKNAGVVIIGKTNMDAWAHGSSTETSDFGPTKNPRNSGYLPGGSSGGSAAAVAADMCLGAIGSETAGSTRQPSAWCGVVGFKPTYGRVSRAGVVAMGSSLDSPGPIGKTVEDCAIILNFLAGQDRYDATTSPLPVPDYTKNFTRGVKGLKIGICYTDLANLDPEVIRSVKHAGTIFGRLGAEVELIPVSEKFEKDKILDPEYAVGVYTVVQRGEVSSNLARYDGIRFGNDRSFFGDEAKRRIMLGTFTLSTGYADKYYVRAQQVRNLYIRNFQNLFEKYDLLISPTSAGFAQKLGATADNPMYGEIEDKLLEPSSLSGLTGINVPCFHDDKTNLYLGLNITGNYFNEEKVLKAAYAFEHELKINSWLKNE